MLRVTAENQSKAPEAFQSWYEVAGTYGGQLGSTGLGDTAGVNLAGTAWPPDEVIA